MLFPEAAKRGLALLAVAVAAPLQAGMWGGETSGGDADLMSYQDHFGVRLLDTALVAPVLPEPTTATEQHPQVAEPSTGSAAAFSAEGVLDARLKSVASVSKDTVAQSPSRARSIGAGALTTAGLDLASLGWQAF